MSHEQHQHAASTAFARCAVVTLSDTRTADTDTSGARIRALLEQSQHHVAYTEILPDDPVRLDLLLGGLTERDDIDAILTTGGTGIGRRDVTIAVIEQWIEQPLPGFGELFRFLSWEQIGSGAMLSRAAAGIARGKLLFAMPGSTAAVELAMTKLILPQLKHLIHELRR